MTQFSIAKISKITKGLPVTYSSRTISIQTTRSILESRFAILGHEISRICDISLKLNMRQRELAYCFEHHNSHLTTFSIFSKSGIEFAVRV